MRTEDFILHEIANDLRYAFITYIGNDNCVKLWEIKIKECKTNIEQNALYISFAVNSDYLQDAKDRFNKAIEVLRKRFSFNLKINELNFEFENIRLLQTRV